MYQKFTFRLFACLLLLCSITGVNKALASHYGAADLYLTYVGNGPTDLRYEMTLIVYKACDPNGSDLSDNYPISIVSLSTGYSNSVTLDTVATLDGTSSLDTLDQLCGNLHTSNSCYDPNSVLPGFIRRVFRDTITLPNTATDWTFTWEGGNRNYSIANFSNAGNEEIYLVTSFNNTGAYYSNSTPRFQEQPIPYICINQNDQFVNLPTDPDYDSLQTLNINPLTFGGANMAYAGGYSITHPFNPTDNYNVNNNTGTATFYPNAAGRYVVAFRCFEYNKYSGEQIGYCSRDVQLSVVSCSANPPALSTAPLSLANASMDTTNGVVITACPGAPISFNINSFSQNGTNNVFLVNSPDGFPAGATFNAPGSGTQTNVTGTFTWTPTGSDIGGHTIEFIAKDSTCNTGQPIVLKNYLVVQIIVLPGVDAGPDGHYCPPNGLPWQINVHGPSGLAGTWSTISGSSVASLSCTQCTDPIAAPAATTTYVFSSANQQTSCKNTDTLTVFVSPAISVDAGVSDTICANQKAQLHPAINPQAGAQFHWSSTDPNYFDTTALQPFVGPYVSANYFLHVTDANGCNYKDSARIVVLGVAPIVNAFAVRDSVCPNGSTMLGANLGQQPCGLAQSQCMGGAPVNYTLGIDNNTSSLPTPYNMQQYVEGDRTQIIYHKDELNAAGIHAGFINSIGFNISSKNSTGPYSNFTIKMGCSSLNAFMNDGIGNIPGLVTVYGPQQVSTTSGWNVYQFAVPYYWDGISNIVIEECWSKTYGEDDGEPDEVYVSTTGFASVNNYGGTYDGPGCGAVSGFSNNSSARPNTVFNLCESTDYSYSWSPSTYLDNPTAAAPVASNIGGPIDYFLTVTSTSNPACKNTDTVHIGVDFSNSISITTPNTDPYVLCQPGYINLGAVAAGNPPRGNLSCGTSGGVNCNSPVTAVIGVNSPGQLYGSSTPFAAGNNPTQHTQFILTHAELVAAGVHSVTIKDLALFVSDSNSTIPYTNLKISVKCTPKSSYLTGNDFVTGLTQVYTSAAYTIDTGWNKFTFSSPYSLDSNMNLAVDFCFANSNYDNNDGVYVTPTGGISTIDEQYYTGDVCSSPGIGYNDTYNQHPTVRINYCDAPDAPFSYAWTPSLYMADSTQQNTVAYVNSPITYHVSTQGRNGCVVTDSIHVIIPSHNYWITPVDTFICVGDITPLHAHGVGAVSYHWFEGSNFAPATSLNNDTDPNPLASPLQTTTYDLVINDAINCPDTVYVTVHIWPLPAVHILNSDTTIKYGTSFNLIVNGGDYFSWQPVGSLSDPSIPNPVANPTDPTLYIVHGIDSHGCANSDSVQVNIDYRDNLMVPSAFTPNGDGRNDVFRLTNITFQKILEFRVFNRWGQEIFSTTDPKGGWDGTWKGTPQDMGAYSYLIRVAYPDGYVETYKGDVTLIR